MSEMLASITLIVTIFFGAYNWGNFDGRKQGEYEMRNKVVLYCIEKSQLCKEEYNNIKEEYNNIWMRGR